MAVTQAMKDRTVKFEGKIPYMYLDTAGNVTVAVGKMLPSDTAAAKLKFFVRSTHAQASDSEIKAEYVLIHSKEKGHVASYYKPFTTMEMKEADIQALLLEELENAESELDKAFGKSDYDSYPAKAQEALVDMMLNLGPNKFKKFVKLNTAVKAKDWNTAANECKRGGISQARNDETKQLFLDCA